MGETENDFIQIMENPRIQLEPRGERGYMELLPITGEDSLHEI